jgi:hypothetical protein
MDGTIMLENLSDVGQINRLGLLNAVENRTKGKCTLVGWGENRK